MAEAGSAFVTLIPSAKGFGVATAKQVGGEVDSAGKGIGSKLGSAMKYGALAVLGGAAIGAVAFTKSAIALEAQFGKTMSVLAATTGSPKAEMKELSALALQMGAETAFSANDASQAMLELARGGISAASIQAGALKGTMTLAAAGELEMGEAANTAVKAMGQFNLAGKDMDKIAAAIAGGANASSASVRDMSFALAQGGLAAHSVGFSIQETTAAFAAFSNAGLEGSDAGTSMKTMLDRLQPATDKADTALRQLGITHKDGTNDFIKANGEFRSMATIAEELRSGTEKLNAAERKRLITQAFGSDAQRAATIFATEGAAGMDKLLKKTSDTGAAQKMAQANMKGTAGAIEMMKGSVETAALAWGQALKPITKFGAGVVTEIANGAIPIIQDFGEHMRGMLKGVDLSGGIKKLMGSIDIGAAFEKIGSAVRGIDWNKISGFFSDFGASVKKSQDPLGPFNDLLHVTGTVLRFAASHAGLLAKALPYLAAGFIGIKVAQAAANVAVAISVPLRIAEVAATRAHVKAVRELAASQVGGIAATTASTAATAASTVAQTTSTAATTTGTTATLRQRVATLASSAASKVAAGAALAWAGVQWALNAAMSANPIGIVVVAVAALVAGVIIAYKKSETFRGIVDSLFGVLKRVWGVLMDNKQAFLLLLGPFGLITAAVITLYKKSDTFRAIVNAAFHAIGATAQWLWNNAVKPAFEGIKDAISAVGAAGKWLWNNVFQPVFSLLVKGIGKVLEFFGKMLQVIGNVPGMGWVGDLGDKLVSAAGKANDLANNINTIPDNKTVNLNVNENWVTTRTVRRGGMGPQLASGGIITRPTLALVGEGRESEAVMPLSKLSGMLNRERAAGGAGSTVLHVYDRDNVLIGTMEAVADGRIHGANQLAGETARAM